MWWFSSTVILCFFLTACGFHPLYIAPGERGALCYPIKIDTISDREGQILRNYLVDLLTPEGPSLKPRYTLSITLTEGIINTGLRRDETTNRKQATLTAFATIRDSKNCIISTFSAFTINSFPVLSENYYADSIAENFAKKEALRLLAEKITLIVSMYLERQCDINP